ncbi:MAG: hypothetical protein JRH07_14095 [Deltaproteobacteria bacterium]|nr:hypothetical protein [Deltaproteobacteria bacterium]
MALYPRDPSTITDTRNRPADMIYGLIDLKLRADSTGGTMVITFYLSAPIPEGYGWYKHSTLTGWYDYNDYALFDPSRDRVTLTLVDGGSGDDDGLANGMIEDPSVLGTSAAAVGEELLGPRSDRGELRGCFISTALGF